MKAEFVSRSGKVLLAFNPTNNIDTDNDRPSLMNHNLAWQR
jgi:hypothetical protein